MRTIRPAELASDEPHRPWSCRGRDIWDAFCAAAEGDAAGLRALLARDPNLYRAEYWYTQPIHFGVREGQLETVRVLLEAGADPGTTALSGDDLLTLARDRGHEAVVRLLEEERVRPERTPPVEIPADHPLYDAAERGDLESARELLNADPGRIAETRASGRRPLSTAVELGHEPIVRLLLERGADPNAPEGSVAPRGLALHAAARAGNVALVELLLAHGTDPNGGVDSSGSATYAARTPEIRKLLMAHGGRLDTYDLVWLGEHDEAVRCVAADPASANAGCGGVLAAACKEGKRELLVRLLDAGASLTARDEDYRSTPLAWAARSVLLEMVELLLSHGSPTSLSDDEPWATPLAWATRRGHADAATKLRGAGAA
jgi:ankyrin repeat protein